MKWKWKWKWKLKLKLLYHVYGHSCSSSNVFESNLVHILHVSPFSRSFRDQIMFSESPPHRGGETLHAHAPSTKRLSSSVIMKPFQRSLKLTFSFPPHSASKKAGNPPAGSSFHTEAIPTCPVYDQLRETPHPSETNLQITFSSLIPKWMTPVCALYLP